jgi:hypothetical protein
MHGLGSRRGRELVLLKLRGCELCGCLGSFLHYLQVSAEVVGQGTQTDGREEVDGETGVPWRILREQVREAALHVRIGEALLELG